MTNYRPATSFTFLTTTIIILLFSPLISAPTAQAKITKGPVLLRLYQNRAALMWETDHPGPGRLFYTQADTAASTGNKIITSGSPLKYTADKVTHTVYIHKLWLDHLQPDRAYRYNVLDVTGIQTDDFTFRTQPRAAKEVKFAVYGDNRTFPDRHRKIVEQIIKTDVDFVVHTGDLVTSGPKYEQWSREFFDCLKGLVETVPIYVAQGNHDLSKQKYFETLLIPPGETNNFSVDYGPVRYLCTDNYTTKVDDLLTLIEASMKESDHPWKFVSYHQPSLNFGGHGSTWGYPQALPRLARAGVDFVITGHSHIYERFRPLAPSDPNSSYVTHITTGGGGAPTYDVVSSDYLAQALSQHHFCIFHIKGNQLTMQAINIDGQIIDELRITKKDNHLNRAYIDSAVPVDLMQLDLGLRHSVAHSKTIPQKEKMFNISCSLSVPELKIPAKVTLKLRDEIRSAYKMGPSATITLTPHKTKQKIQLMAVPRVEITTSDRGKLLQPPLWLDCHYETPLGNNVVSLPVRVKP